MTQESGLPTFPFDLAYSRLPKTFFENALPTLVRNPQWVGYNSDLAKTLGLPIDVSIGDTGPGSWGAIFSGNEIPVGSVPIAQAYSGHQFGRFSPNLGDGRAILLGEIRDPHGTRWDLQLKGSGRTPFSRRGDGRAALGPMLREWIIGEALFCLEIPTTRILAVMATGETVYREKEHPGAVATRIASSHIRVGTFEYFASRGEIEAIRSLLDFSIQRHDPELIDTPNRYLQFFERVIQRQANLIAQWMSVGFVHGVMNTDNMAISGQSIDFGPCAFLEEYGAGVRFSSIDENGRYAFGNQPSIALWNLTRLAECLLPVLDSDLQRSQELATVALEKFAPQFNTAWLTNARRKLGLVSEEPADADLIQNFLLLLEKNQLDFTLSFRNLAISLETEFDQSLFEKNPDPAALLWFQQWKSRLESDRQKLHCLPRQQIDLMNSSNPLRIARNHRVEEAIRAAEDHADYTVAARLIAGLKNPFNRDPAFQDLESSAKPEERITETFCGT